MPTDPDHEMKRGDTDPPVRVQVTDAAGNSVNLAGASAQFHMVDEDGTVVLDKPATIVNEADGRINYEWDDGDTDTAGTYEAEFEITKQDGDVQTWPNSWNLIVEIGKDIN